MKAITIIVDKVGQVAIQANGFDGNSCRDATRALEQGLGIVLSDKPHYDQPIPITSTEVTQ